jgi:hypothetical protein
MLENVKAIHVRIILKIFKYNPLLLGDAMVREFTSREPAE